MTDDSIFKPIKYFRPSMKADRSSFTSLLSFAISCTFLSALCELAIITIARMDTKMINRQFLKASSLTKKVPFRMLYRPFPMLYNLSAILNFALRALLLFSISSSDGTINLPTFLNGTEKRPYKSRSGSPSNMPFLTKRFTSRSSKE